MCNYMKICLQNNFVANFKFTTQHTIYFWLKKNKMNIFLNKLTSQYYQEL